MGVNATVLLPTNNNPFLCDSLQSIRNDVHQKDAILFLLDNSITGVSQEVLRMLGSHDTHFRFEPSASLASMLNFGIQNSSTEFLYRMDDDDIWLEGRFRSQLKLLESGNQLVIGQAKFINGHGKSIPRSRLSGLPEFEKTLLLLGNYILHPSVAYVRTLFNEFKYEDTIYEDYHLWLRIFRSNIRYATSDLAVNYRVRSGALSEQFVAEASLFNLYTEYVSFCHYIGVTELQFKEFLYLVKPRASTLEIDRNSTENLRSYMTELVRIPSFQSEMHRLQLSDFAVGISQFKIGLLVKFWPFISRDIRGLKRLLRQVYRYIDLMIQRVRLK